MSTATIASLRHKPEFLTPYPVVIRFVKGQKEWDMVRGITGGDEDMFAGVLKTTNGHGTNVLLFYISDKALAERRIAATIAHEAMHAVLYVADISGFPPGVGDTSEPIAYLMDDLVTKAMDYYGVTSSVKRRRRSKR